MNNVKTAISIDMYYGNKDTAVHPVTEETTFINNIHLTNITAVNVENAAQIFGLPEAPVEDFSISNSNFRAEHGFDVSNVHEFTLRDIKVSHKVGPPLSVYRGTNIEIDNFQLCHTSSGKETHALYEECTFSFFR